MLLAGCKASGPSVSEKAEESEVLQDGTVVNAELYTIERINGKYYLEPKKGKEKDPYWNKGCVRHLNTIYGNSLKELREKIYTGSLTQHDIDEVVNGFPRDENNNIPIADLENLYIPKLPESASYGYVNVGGEEYYFFLRDNITNSHMGNFHIITQKSFEKVKSDFDTYSPSDLISSTTISGQNATVYIYGSESYMRQKINFSINLPDKTLYVSETYLIRNTENSKHIASDSIPTSVEIFGIDNGVFFKVIFFYSYDFTEKPDIEFYKSFGVEKYVE